MKKIKKLKKKKNKQQDYFIPVVIVLCILVSSYLGYEIYSLNKKPEKQENKINNIQKNNVIKPIEQKPQEVKPQVILPEFHSYKYKYTYTFNIKGNIKNFSFKIPLPQNETDKQYKTFENNYTPPDKYSSDGVNHFVEYNIPQIGNTKLSYTFEGNINVRNYDLKTAKLINKNSSPEKDLTRYLKAEPLIEANDPYIKEIANKIQGNSKEEILQNIYEYLQKNIKYAVIPNCGAKKALKNRKGKCAEYSAAMIAICRAKNIPARLVSGYIAREYNQKHGWVEVYFDEYGWVTYDPTAEPLTIRTADKQGNIIKEEKIYNAGELQSDYIISGRNNFTPWFLQYSIVKNSAGKVNYFEDIEIIKN